jgi:hypothetical protein
VYELPSWKLLRRLTPTDDEKKDFRVYHARFLDDRLVLSQYENAGRVFHVWWMVPAERLRPVELDHAESVASWGHLSADGSTVMLARADHDEGGDHPPAPARN